MSLPRRAFRRFDHGGLRLVLLLLVAVVVPSACVLWFMNEAVINQAAAARQAVVEAYRGQLRLVRDRVNAHWEAQVADLDARLSGRAAEDFAREVGRGAADSVVIVGKDGVPRYPALLERRAVPLPPGGADDAAALGAQLAVRDLLRLGDRRRAIDLIRRTFLRGSAARGRDAEGRSIAADARLLLVSLLPSGDRRREVEIAALATLLNDYAEPTLPSSQRVFLMTELRGIAGREHDSKFPTLDAERLALTYLERNRVAPTGSGLRPTTDADLWHAPAPSGRAIGLYRFSTITQKTNAILADQASRDVSFVVIRPGQARDSEAIAIGAALPGWELTLARTTGPGEADPARSRRNAYLSVAAVAIGLITAAIIMLAGTARSHARLASLKSDLVSTVSHELKTPVASMQLLVDGLLRDDQLDPTKTREYLQLMDAENKRLTRLIENFLTFSRLERNRYQFDFKPTAAGDLVADAVAGLSAERRAERAPVVEVASGLPTIAVDRDAVVTALLNLLDNAYKYSPAGEPVRVRVFADGHSIVFAIDDRGIGIPLREQRRIFRRFYRVDQRLARDTAGSGLGLSIVDAIVRAHGGRVRVDSQPQRGSTFAIRLPFAAEGTSP